jgi:beta-glucanase (GH16 family)
MGKKLQIAALLTIFSIAVQAQIYTTDPGYFIDTLHSDDFDRNYLKSWKWTSYNGYGQGLEIYQSSNVLLAGDTLSIKIDSITVPVHYNGTTYGYHTGGFDCGPTGTPVKYGYFEMKARLPYNNVFLWPSLWLWNENCSTPADSAWYQEVDILEAFDADMIYGRSYHGNRYASDPAVTNTLTTCPLPGHLIDTRTQTTTYKAAINVAPSLMYNSFHKYALLWTPDSLVYYFDDNPVAMVTTFVPQHAMWIILNVSMSSTVFPYHWAHPALTSPKYMTLDYFRYYKKNADCSTNKTICNPTTDYYNANPPRAVEKTIVSGGGTCVGSVTYNTSDKCTLRATDSITLDAGTTISDNGSGYFAVSIEPCPQ